MKKHIPVRRQPKKAMGLIPSVFAGALLSVLLGMLLLVISCFPALALSDPLRFAPVFAIASLFVATAVGAYTAAKLHGKSGLACGVLSTLVLILAIVSAACAFSLKIRFSLFMICAPILLIVSAISGISGVSEKEMKPHRHKHTPARFR